MRRSMPIVPSFGLLMAISLLGASAARAEETRTDSPDWVVPSLHSAGVLALGRIGITILWPDAFDNVDPDRNWDTLKTSWSSPPQFDATRDFFEWDGNAWPQNLVVHGLMGSEFYLRYRETRHGPYVALAMSFAWSALWEYGVEGWFVQPSGIDLFWTPIGGMLIGEGRYQLYREILGMKPSRTRHTLLYLVDPLGQLERDLLGLKE